MTSCKACRLLRGWPAGVDSARARGATYAGQRPQGNASGDLASVGDPGKSRQKRQGRAPQCICLARLSSEIGHQQPTERNESGGRSQLAGQLGKTERYGIMGTQEKPRAGFDLNVLNAYLNYIRLSYLTSSTDELNDKQGKK